ncbi:hypothetical protein ACG2F4_16310 [Halalkalibaculum sp. DA3122]|uniref:hypothetical protein n=1 Tax=unclassified Halalkalibaculum TaxID=2964617 RepID=UPI0037541403
MSDEGRAADLSSGRIDIRPEEFRFFLIVETLLYQDKRVTSNTWNLQHNFAEALNRVPKKISIAFPKGRGVPFCVNKKEPKKSPAGLVIGY